MRSDNGRDNPVAANKLNIKTDVKCDLGSSHCYLAFVRLYSMNSHESGSPRKDHKTKRPSCFANKTAFKLDNGKLRQIAPGRLHGYQVEIDPSERGQSGGIYDEARRRWLDKPEDDAPSLKALKSNQWNHMRIKCDGDHIQSWVNGVQAADLKDDVTPNGFIALQVHGANGRKQVFNTQVQWRNIRIKLLD